eukprot:364896-Chlamydomonas_euryale.AAC.4
MPCCFVQSGPGQCPVRKSDLRHPQAAAPAPIPPPFRRALAARPDSTSLVTQCVGIDGAAAGRGGAGAAKRWRCCCGRIGAPVPSARPARPGAARILPRIHATITCMRRTAPHRGQPPHGRIEHAARRGMRKRTSAASRGPWLRVHTAGRGSGINAALGVMRPATPFAATLAGIRWGKLAKRDGAVSLPPVWPQAGCTHTQVPLQRGSSAGPQRIADLPPQPQP